MALGDHYRVTFKMNVVRQPASITVNYRETTAGHSARQDTLALADYMATNAANLNVLLGQDATYEGFLVEKLDGERVAPVSQQFDGRIGAQVGTSLPLTKATIIQLIQIEGPAKHNGRLFFPPPTEEDTTGNFISNQAYLNLVDTQFQAIQRPSNTFEGDAYNWQMCIIEQASILAPPLRSRLVEFVRTVPLIRNQRRRRTRELGTSGAAN